MQRCLAVQTAKIQAATDMMRMRKGAQEHDMYMHIAMLSYCTCCMSNAGVHYKHGNQPNMWTHCSTVALLACICQVCAIQIST